MAVHLARHVARCAGTAQRCTNGYAFAPFVRRAEKVSPAWGRTRAAPYICGMMGVNPSPIGSRLAIGARARRFATQAPVQNIFEVDQQTFVPAVLESREPVILNCYAEWCREQLSTMANAVAGTPGIKLAVMDVDKCPEIAQQLKVQNLPTIFLFHNGKVKQSTVGSLSADGIQTFIKKATALSGGTAPSANELMIQAGKLLSESRVEEALQVYMQVAQMSREVHGASALAGMTLCALAVKDMEAAKELVETIKKDFPKALEDEIVKQAITAVELSDSQVDAEGMAELKKKLDTNVNDHDSRHDLALALFGSQKYGEAMQQTLEIIKRDKAWKDGKARQLLFKFFDTLGNDHPDVSAARKKLSSLLF